MSPLFSVLFRPKCPTAAALPRHTRTNKSTGSQMTKRRDSVRSERAGRRSRAARPPVQFLTPELAARFLAEVGTGERRLAIVRDLEGLHAVVRARADELQVARTTIDDLAGTQSGYASKVLAPKPIKTLLGRRTLGPILGALGLALIVVEDKEALVRIASRLVKKHHGVDASLGSLPTELRIAVDQSAAAIVKQARHEWSRRANQARKRLPKRERRRIATIAARARWRQ